MLTEKKGPNPRLQLFCFVEDTRALKKSDIYYPFFQWEIVFFSISVSVFVYAYLQE